MIYNKIEMAYLVIATQGIQEETHMSMKPLSARTDSGTARGLASMVSYKQLSTD